MKIRPIIFWSHLAAGIAAGLVILTMSVTGVLLTYERQIVDWVDRNHQTERSTERDLLTADELVFIATGIEPGASQVTLTYRNDPESIIKIRAGRDRNLLVDPRSGDVLQDGKSGAETFFDTVTQIHRWFALSGDARSTGRAVTGYSNLLFLYLLLSGVYLWLPRIWNRAIVKTKIFINPKARTGKARDFNWHHVFAFWSIVPLFFIVTTATVFYFPWASQLVYTAYGEQAPERRQRSNVSIPQEPSDRYLTNSELLQLARNELKERGVTDWESVSMQASPVHGAPASFRIDRSIGGQPSSVYNLTLDGIDGRVTEWSTFSDKSPGAQARSNIRFLHTGEVLGVGGQTVAGLASLAASILVWTGLALAWRRLLLPLFRKRRDNLIVNDVA